MIAFTHKPVMPEECMQGLAPEESGVYFDGTVGGGGHSYEILRRSSPGGRLIATDLDENAIAAARQRLQEFAGRFRIYKSNFKRYAEVLAEHRVQLHARIAEFVAEVVHVASQKFVVLYEPVQSFQYGRHFERRGGQVLQRRRDQLQKCRTDEAVVFFVLFGAGVVDLQQDLFDLLDLVALQSEGKAARAQVRQKPRGDLFERVLQIRFFDHDVDVAHGCVVRREQAVNVSRGRRKSRVRAVCPHLPVAAVVDAPVGDDREFPIVGVPVFDGPVKQIDVVEEVRLLDVAAHVQRRALVKVVPRHCVLLL